MLAVLGFRCGTVLVSAGIDPSLYILSTFFLRLLHLLVLKAKFFSVTKSPSFAEL